MRKRSNATLEQIDSIINLYAKERKSSIQIGQIFGFSKKYVLDILHRNNCPLRTAVEGRTKNNINHDYFKSIDSMDKAYFLGLLYADGCNTGTRIEISLAEEDGYILEKFKNIINHSYEILFRNGVRKEYKNVSTFAASSTIICNDLFVLGCFPRKSLTLKFPTHRQVPDYLIHHFIRGYFDGDGGIAICKNKDRPLEAQIGFTSSRDFCLALQEFLRDKKIINTCLTTKDNTLACSIVGGGSNQIYRLYKFLYEDCEDLFLTRKKEKFEKFLFEMRNFNKDGTKKKKAEKRQQ